MCHALFLTNGYTSPDGLNEGLFFYWNQRWALSLGRWMMEYLSESVYNVVMPPVYLAFNGLCAAGVMLLLADLWKMHSKVFVVLGTLSLVVAPSVIWQNLVIHVAYSYGFAMLLAVLAVYLVFSKKGALSFVAAVVCLVLSMGTYQADIGFATGTVLFTLMLWCLQEHSLAELARKTGKALAMGVIGGILYFAILQEEAARYHVAISDRGGLSSFGAGSLAGDWSATPTWPTMISSSILRRGPTIWARHSWWFCCWLSCCWGWDFSVWCAAANPRRPCWRCWEWCCRWASM